MHNMVYLIGRIEFGGDDKTIYLNVNTNEKIKVKCQASDQVYENVVSCLHNGDLIGIKGHFDLDNIVICDKVSFLASKKSSE